MSDKSYPRPWFKDLHLPQWSASAKDDLRLEADGWTDDSRNLPFQEYPKTIYKPDGTAVAIGSYNKDGILNLELAKFDETRLLASGYTLDRPAITPLNSHVVLTAGTMALLPKSGSPVTRLDDLEVKVAVMGDTLTTILEELRGNSEAAPKRGRGRPRKDGSEEVST